jgi:SWI/SNF-related matrix-associated actin-dependent regulator of chromatin subfamily A member 5
LICAPRQLATGIRIPQLPHYATTRRSNYRDVETISLINSGVLHLICIVNSIATLHLSVLESLPFPHLLHGHVLNSDYTWTSQASTISVIARDSSAIRRPLFKCVLATMACTPKVNVNKLNSAEELLALFSPTPQPQKKLHVLQQRQQQYEIKMSSPRRLRHKATVTYVISDESENDSDSYAEKERSSGRGRGRPKRQKTDSSSEEDITEEEAATPPPRVSSAGHSLRQHSQIKQSLVGKENADKPRRKKKRGRGRPRVSDSAPAPRVKTERNKIRDEIAAGTAVKRAAFFAQHKDAFLPLLPERNQIVKLLDELDVDGEDKDETEKVIAYEEIKEQPDGVKATMKPYQLKGLSFLVYLQRNGLSGILGDEMGLGKTLQTLALLQWLKLNRPSTKGAQDRPSIVICPLSVLDSWMSEARKWTPGLKTLRFHGSSTERARMKRIASGYESLTNSKGVYGLDLLVTTYETFVSEQGWFKGAFVWTYVVLDEGHKVKNHESNVSHALQGLKAEFRLVLTGTPLQNNLVELWSILHWLYPEVFTEKTSDAFRTSFNLTKGKVNTDFIDHARRLLELIMLRRMKHSPGVDLKLPPKEDVLLHVPLTSVQRELYTALLTRADQGLLEHIFSNSKEKEAMDIEKETVLHGWEHKNIDQLEMDEQEGFLDASFEQSKQVFKQNMEADDSSNIKKSTRDKLLNLLMQLRKVCGHPYMISSAMPESYYVGEHIVAASGKLQILDKLICELVIKQKKKMLIFSGFTRMLDFAEDFLSLRSESQEKFGYLRLDGSTCRARRNLAIRLFQDQSSPYSVMLISTRAGGLGLNLTAATEVVFLDSDFNPQVMLQAEARAHRIGQTKPVTTYKLCTSGTVEEQMLGRIQKKLYLSAKVTESMRNVHELDSSKKKGRPSGAGNADTPMLSATEIMSLVRRGAQAISHPELKADEVAGWDFDTMLQKCRDNPANALNATDTASKAEEEKKWLAEVEHVQTRLFDGKKFAKSYKHSDRLTLPETSRADRRVGKNTTVMVDGHVVSKESMNCGDWEAVPTYAGKDPRLADVKREKKPEINNQEHCQVCWDGGDLTLCSHCPRSYHYGCLDKDMKAQARGKLQFSCNQHQCAECLQKGTECGGMLYRCRWCERAYCDDDLDMENSTLIGDALPEYQLLGFGPVIQAFYIECSNCKAHYEENVGEQKFRQEMQAEYDEAYKKRFGLTKAPLLTIDTAGTRSPSEDESMTDGVTASSSSISTPRLLVVPPTGKSLKRKLST